MPALIRRESLRLAAAVVLAGAVGLAGIAAGIRHWTSTPALRRQAENALLAGRFAEAERLGRKLMERGDQRARGALIAGEAASQLARYNEALTLFEQMPRNNPALAVAGDTARARILLTAVPRLAEAELAVRSALDLEFDNGPALSQLSYVLGLQGRTWEATLARIEMLRHGQGGLQLLVLLGLGNSAAENPEESLKFSESNPDDPHALCGAAHAAMRQNQNGQARQQLLRVVAAEPNLLQAQAWLGSLLAADGTAAEFFDWHGRLPPDADEHPDIWMVRAAWARREADWPSVIRCLWEAVRIDPNHQAGNYQLAQSLIAQNCSAAADPFLKRSKTLGNLVIAAKTCQISEHVGAMREAARLTDELGLAWEAWGWRNELLQRGLLADNDPLLATDTFAEFRIPRGAGERLEDYRERLTANRTARTDPTQIGTWRPDPKRFPMPDWSRQAAAPAGRMPVVLPATRAFSFVDQAAATGLKFQFVNGSRPESAGEFMYEFSGGGVGVLDYDGDGWPDLYLTQGTDWPPRPENRAHLDRLFRNRSGDAFADVTNCAGLSEERFSQGVAVGDLDNDGFPDLFVANIGANRLYRNNGDGTFCDATQASELSGAAWSTSCALADFNADGLPDIYVVNYVAGEHLFDRPCLLPDGSPRLCTPHEYEADDDQLLLNLGDGRFRDISREAGLLVPGGKGLGIVVADFENSGRLSAFVANDSVPNFLFVNTTRAPGDVPRFEERGFAAGVAVDAQGRAKAGMGIAAGDADADGLTDLVVTNFRLESSTLFLQQPDLLFVDATANSGLREPTFDRVGFGAQFLDADLDGLPDLVMTNGHVGNLSRHGVPYEMPTQFFAGAGGGRFCEIPAARLGPFFAGKHLGRALARLDWNRDGREDFAISRLEQPAALVTNDTRATGRFLAVHLRGVTCSRDALGAVVSVRAGRFHVARQLVGGDGYQSSNQRLLVFGLGDLNQIDEVSVRWPGGAAEIWREPPMDSEIVIVEGRNNFAVVARPDQNSSATSAP
jgi:tetratricopeptide (TPR) repeat protein